MEGFAQNYGPSYSDVPYNERWELLKPFMEQLYIQEKRKLPDVVDIMKSRHKFYAS
jgi:Clr5 domain